jgi:hypothetical protein
MVPLQLDFYEEQQIRTMAIKKLPKSVCTNNSFRKIRVDAFLHLPFGNALDMEKRKTS